MSVRIVTIGTGKYLDYALNLGRNLRKFWKSENHNNLKLSLLTDTPKDYIKDNPFDDILYQDHLAWPLVTLLRFHNFIRYEDKLFQDDYLIFMNSNLQPVTEIGDDLLGDIIAVQHPGFYNTDARNATYELNLWSKAYVNVNNLQFRTYVQGCLMGGKSDIFLKLCRIMKDNINEDLKHLYIPRWYDESFWNRIVQDHHPTKLLDPGYAYPESWDLPFEKKIISLDKNHDKIRN